MSALRFMIAYLTAPLAITAIELRLWEPRPLYYEAYLLVVYCTVGFLGALLFGTSVYFFLQKRKWTSFWVALIAGFVVAGLIWSLVEVVLLALFGGRYLEFHGYLDWLRAILWPYGPLGALVASLLWVMARLERAGGKENADEG
jgi:hypothetical protein